MGRGVTLRVLHAVVQHAARAQHPGHVLDGRLEAVGRVVTRTLVVPLVIVELLTVSGRMGRAVGSGYCFTFVHM